MNPAAKAVIASIRAIDPSQSDAGPVMGHNAANAISDALDEAGYVVVHRSALKELKDGMESVLINLGVKK